MFLCILEIRLKRYKFVYIIPVHILKQVRHLTGNHTSAVEYLSVYDYSSTDTCAKYQYNCAAIVLCISLPYLRQCCTFAVVLKRYLKSIASLAYKLAYMCFVKVWQRSAGITDSVIHIHLSRK